MKLELNFVSSQKINYYFLTIFVICIFIFAYTLWERSILINKYDNIQMTKNKKEVYRKSIPIKRKEVSSPPLFEKQIAQIAIELTAPRGKILDSIQHSLVPQVVLSNIQIEDINDIKVEGIVRSEDSLNGFMQNLINDNSWKSVVIENEESLASSDTSEILQIKNNNQPINQKVKFTLSLKWGGG